MRFKIYEKTLDKMTSNGVANTNISDPSFKLFFLNAAHDKHLLSYKGYALGRLECSFYSPFLQQPEVYEKIINLFYPRNEKILITYRSFSLNKITDYW